MMVPFEMFTPVRPPKVGVFCGIATRITGVDKGFVVREPVGDVQCFIDGQSVPRDVAFAALGMTDGGKVE